MIVKKLNYKHMFQIPVVKECESNKRYFRK
jgi:hypothetical protein